MILTDEGDGVSRAHLLNDVVSDPLRNVEPARVGEVNLSTAGLGPAINFYNINTERLILLAKGCLTL